ncbi:DUF4158 domain-containing protein [Nocardia vinacea]|uniref:DUF4158 domain-containing protein n=1 Tax=Nocardia vinacea TaxID=96468 RepID=UPI0034271F0F
MDAARQGTGTGHHQAGCGETRFRADAAVLYRAGRFPRGRAEIPDAAVDYIARQVGVERTEIAFYDFTGRTNKAHREQIRESLGFRECGVSDAEEILGWLVEHVPQRERSGEIAVGWLHTQCFVFRYAVADWPCSSVRLARRRTGRCSVLRSHRVCRAKYRNR